MAKRAFIPKTHIENSTFPTLRDAIPKEVIMVKSYTPRIVDTLLQEEPEVFGAVLLMYGKTTTALADCAQSAKASSLLIIKRPLCNWLN